MTGQDIRTGNMPETIKKFDECDLGILCMTHQLVEGHRFPNCDGISFMDDTRMSFPNFTQHVGRCRNSVSSNYHIITPFVVKDDSDHNNTDYNCSTITKIKLYKRSMERFNWNPFIRLDMNRVKLSIGQF